MNGYNFSESVRHALADARVEAAELHHEYVGTEHVLLGLIHEGDGVACAILRNLGVDTGELRNRVLTIVQRGHALNSGTDLPYTSRAKKTLELAMTEAREHNQSYVGTEHLLLGLLREAKGLGAQVLNDAGVTTENARAAMLAAQGRGAADAGSPARAERAATSRDPVANLPDRLRRVIALAHDVAAERQSLQVAPTHVCMALLEHDGGMANAVLDNLGLDRAAALAALDEVAPRGSDVVGPDDVMTLHPDLTPALAEMAACQRSMRAPTAGTHHLLLGLVAVSWEVASMLAKQGIDASRIREEMIRISG